MEDELVVAPIRRALQLRQPAEGLIIHRSDFYGLCNRKRIRFIIFFTPLNDRVHAMD